MRPTLSISFSIASCATCRCSDSKKNFFRKRVLRAKTRFRSLHGMQLSCEDGVTIKNSGPCLGVQTFAGRPGPWKTLTCHPAAASFRPLRLHCSHLQIWRIRYYSFFTVRMHHTTTHEPSSSLTSSASSVDDDPLFPRCFFTGTFATSVGPIKYSSSAKSPSYSIGSLMAKEKSCE